MEGLEGHFHLDLDAPGVNGKAMLPARGSHIQGDRSLLSGGERLDPSMSFGAGGRHQAGRLDEAEERAESLTPRTSGTNGLGSIG